MMSEYTKSGEDYNLEHWANQLLKKTSTKAERRRAHEKAMQKIDPEILSGTMSKK